MDKVTRRKIISTLIIELTFLFLVSFTITTSPVYATEWSPDTRLTWNENADFSPSITQMNDGTIWIIWHAYDIEDNSEIFYKTYNKSLTNPWSPNARLTTNPNVDKTPSITQTADGRVWVVWSSNRTGDYEIFYKIYDGSIWSSDTRLTQDEDRDESPSIMQDVNGRVWVVWSSNRTGDYEIFYKIYDGSIWSQDARLTNNPSSDDKDPSIIQTLDEKFWVVWVRNNDLYYKVFHEEKEAQAVLATQLTWDPGFDLHPSIIQTKNGIIWFVWSSDRIYGQGDIFFKTYDGYQWSLEQTLTDDLAEDIMPSITQAKDGTIWIAWTSLRLNNIDIYYKTDSPPEYLHDIAIISVTHSPNTVVVYQGLNLSIEVVPQNQGLENEYVRVDCYANSTLIGSEIIHLSVGHLMPVEFKWDTRNVNPGNYVISANATVQPSKNNPTGIDEETADNILSGGAIQVRIPGDADFNGIVELYDFVWWADNFGKTAEELLLSRYPDFDNNGYVEMKDFPIWVANFGKEYR